MIRSRSVVVVVLVAVSCVGASWLPWASELQRSSLELQKAPNNDFNILHFNATTICLRLSASISILVQYKTERVRDGAVQIIVPHLTKENVEGSCGPDASLHLSWPSPDATTESPTPEEANALNVEETSWSEPTVFDDVSSNTLHFDFVQQNDSYFIANISGFININDVSEDYSPNSTVIELSVRDQKLFEAPLGIVSMCYGKTLVEGEVYGNVTAVTLVFTDVQLLAYHEESFWPNQVSSCRSSPVLEIDNTVAIVVGTLAAVVGVGLLGAFIYYLRTR
ncbi:uncharacterized protein LOC124622636 [Schistocerca americana]|uniref:uncharacterized protein LOC124622636 n=1 Tax=Schistocerca americana TaxID=7009 RepID=UPI001F50076C|nr:uncharacterized protein LOC124622636 [Schistocerca americana]